MAFTSSSVKGKKGWHGSLTLDVLIDTDSEGPRGRTGRPESRSETPSSAHSSRSRHSTLSHVHFEEPNMCNPLASPRSDTTITAVPVPVPVKSTNPKVGLPSTSVADSSSQSSDALPGPSHDKRNAFAHRKTKPAAPSHPPPRSSLRSSLRSTLRSSSIPPVPPIPVSILKSRPGNITLTQVKPRSSSAPPSPPKMDDSSNVPEGNNKPLPVSPSIRHDPHTPSPRTPSFRSDGMFRSSLSPMERPSGVSPTTPHRSSLTLKDLPEAVRSLQYRYETDINRLSKKIDNINKLEQKVDDFVTVTRDYFKDQMDAQRERQSDMCFEIAKANDAKGQFEELKKHLDEIKEDIPVMRTEINELTSSFNDLSAKVDMCLTGIWDNTEEPFVAYQRRKNREIDEDIQDIGSQTEDQNRQITFLRRMFIQIQMAFDVLQHDHGLQVSEDVKKILPPNPLPAHDTVPTTGTLRSLASFGSGAIPPANTDAPAKAASPAQTAPPAKATPTSTTTAASATASATITPPGSSTAKQSSIPRRSKKKSLKKTSRSSVAKQTSTNKTEEVPAVPTTPQGIRVPRDAVREVPVPMADIHPLFRPQFNEVNAPGMPGVHQTAEPSGRVSPVETGKDEARK
ncbi:unnamed protein product [Penicillium egyptiacum]|uniref:Uncharacterized protein n=1 Tax=Penicillium egyptiacum TaxID=1303716 RepID=A0A9W4KDY9_9EURO|nr:unnamed protein product [Penicillium egyptiacum]